MGSLLRSSEMELVQIFMQMDAAHDTIDELARLACAQFIDLNPHTNAFSRNFVAEVRRASEMERKLRYISEQAAAHRANEASSSSSSSSSLLLSSSSSSLRSSSSSPALDGEQGTQLGMYEMVEQAREDMPMNRLQHTLEDLEKELQLLKSNESALLRNEHELRELVFVLTSAADIFAGTAATEGATTRNARTHAVGRRPPRSQRQQQQQQQQQQRDGGGRLLPLELSSESETSTEEDMTADYGLNTPMQATVGLRFVAGCIEYERVTSFQRLLWRAARGNVFVRTSEDTRELKDPTTNENKNKVVFCVFFQGSTLEQRVRKICESYNANLYHCPEARDERQSLLDETRSRLAELEDVLSRTFLHRRKLFAEHASIDVWRQRILQEKAIWHTLNQCNYDHGRHCVIAECWLPRDRLQDVRQALEDGQQRSGATTASVMTLMENKALTPPTFFATNKFTASFQALTDSYGVANYREVNPAVFTIITFPFLFGVMFGDIGHGIFLTLFGGYLCWRERQLEESMASNDTLGMVFGGRYLLVLMGLFSIYAGFMYNECFGIPLNIFNSPHYEQNDPAAPGYHTFLVAYPFGADPAWKYAPNELDYFNSLKMKLSIILGVSHMMLGLVCSLLNFRYYKKTYAIVLEFVPQVLFLGCLFGYLCLMIVIKWLINYRGHEHDAPQLLITMINMFMHPLGQTADPDAPPPPPELYKGQTGVQFTLLAIALIQVPIMLLGKPLWLRREHLERVKRRVSYYRVAATDETDDDDDDDEPDFKFSEVMTHQIIHTIEYVLGAISNTASYLRLWALSLAHAKLSGVFWELVMNRALEHGSQSYSALMLFVAFAVWAALTIGVLMVMESLSAFLHALRLHWVEFMGKFYGGEGVQFEPLSFRDVEAYSDANFEF